MPSELQVKMFPCLSDNYGFLVHDPESGETATIDTPDAEEILRQAELAGWRITQIWNTHHHPDHAGGNKAVKLATDCTVVAPEADRHRIPEVDVGVKEGDEVKLGAHVATVRETPGHTTGHVVYHFAGDGIAFVGDTLFALGCGRLFEGSPEDMWSSLKKLLDMPDDTTVYCAHEYTQANARFALTVDPDNPDLLARADRVDAARAKGEPTVPTTIGLERKTNPFLRPDSEGIRKTLEMADADDVDVFAEVRRRKDAF
jgi:hydroxyacylglutathione hydrolase